MAGAYKTRVGKRKMEADDLEKKVIKVQKKREPKKLSKEELAN